MKPQFPQTQFTQEQGQQARDQILQLVQQANLPAEVLVEIGQWAQQVIENPKLFPEFQAWLASRGLDKEDIPEKPDYQELTSMIMIGQVAGNIKSQEPTPEPTAQPTAPIAPDQMPQVAAQGRNGDTMLAHINAEEAQMLKSMGGTGTVNPATGLPEFGFFSDLWKGVKKVVKAVAPYVLPAVAIFYPPAFAAIGSALGASAALAPIVGASVIAGGTTALSGGSVKDVLQSAALTGLGAYLTPVVGKYVGGLTGIESPALQSVIGSGAFSGGVAAVRGASVSQILTAAATGAAGNYLGQLATEVIPTITSTSATQKGFEDALFLAADAKGLADAGIGKNQMAQILQQTGVSSVAANEAISMAVAGKSANEIAKVITNKYASGSLYTNKASGAQQSVIGGANVKALESVQQAEDALFIANDAKNLRAAGLNESQIVQNLRAAGVPQNAASMAASEAMRGATIDAAAQSVINVSRGAVLFGEPTIINTPTGGKVPARELGTEPVKEITKTELSKQAFDTAIKNVTPDYTTGTTASDIEFAIADARGLKAQGITNAAQLTQILIESGMNPQQANYLGKEVAYGTPDNYLKYDLNNMSRNTPIYKAAPPPPAPVVPETPVAPPPEVTPVAPPPSTDNTTTQIFDDGSELITDNNTGQVVGGKDTAGTPIVVPPPAPTPPPPAPAPEPTPTPTPTPTPQPVVPPPAPAQDLSTNVQVFDDGSILITDGTGRPIGNFDVNGNSTTLRLNPMDDGSFIVTDLNNTVLGGLDNQGNIFGLDNTGNGVVQGTYKPPAPPPAPAPEPTPPPATGAVDVSTNVQIFDDGSVLITDGSGRPLGNIDTDGNSALFEKVQFDDGSFIIVGKESGEIYGGLDNSGNIYRIDETGNGIYQETRTPLTQPPGEPPLTPVPPPDEGYGEGFPEEVDISGSNPPPEPPPVDNIDDLPPLEEPPQDNIDDLPPLEEPPIETPEIPFIPPYVPPEPTPPGPTPQGTYVPAPPDPRWSGRIPLPGLNPGYMEQGVKPMYETTSPVQSQYYWGKQPYMESMSDLQRTYNQVPGAPEQPWGTTQGWWEQPIDYSKITAAGPIVPQGMPQFNSALPQVDYRAQANQMIRTPAQLAPYNTFLPATQGQYYDANGNPVNSL